MDYFGVLRDLWILLFSPMSMTLACWLRVSSSPLDVFLRSERLTPLEKLRNAPQFPLAFEGPLLPLSAHEPALPPLFALPPPLGARSPDIGVLPTKGNITFALQRYYIFPFSVCQRSNILKKIDAAYGGRGAGRSCRRGGVLLSALPAVSP